MSKRVYKFISAEYGILNLKNKRLKLSTLDDLNDPFDLYSIDTTHPQIAQVVMMSIAQFKGTNGLLCLSRNWDNLLLWSHYGASHTGLCLGFDIPDDSPGDRFDMDVHYQPNLLRIRDAKDINFDLANRLLCTKHESCRAEDANAVCEVLKEYPEEIECTWAYMRTDAFLLVRSKSAHANVFRPSERAFSLHRDTLS